MLYWLKYGRHSAPHTGLFIYLLYAFSSIPAVYCLLYMQINSYKADTVFKISAGTAQRCTPSHVVTATTTVLLPTQPVLLW